MPSRAIALLYKGKQMFPQSYAISANLGSALGASSRYTEGGPEIERALGLQPSSTEVLNNLGIFYSKKHDDGVPGEEARVRACRGGETPPGRPAGTPALLSRAAAEAARTML